MDMRLRDFHYYAVRLTDVELCNRRNANRTYLMKLQNENLLLNYKLEAGLWGNAEKPENIHWGWESPTCQLRGHFLGHWLSGAAQLYAATGDAEIKAKADTIVGELALCQKENGGEWVGSIPEKYLDWIAQGKSVWAPQYTLHKTFMGLLDMYRFAGNEQALEIAVNWAKWFTRWTGRFSREQMDDILDFETGGMLEIWSELYDIKKAPEFRELMDRYYRQRLFDVLLAGEDVLTNMHANTTIPEILGAARAWEVTGEKKWMDIVTAYWDQAVTQRGQYCTGGQTCGEIWSPKGELSARLGDKNQEHCTVYNMMRLAEFLLRWTGDAKYADYWEQNLYNGIMAQGYWEGSATHGYTSEYPLSGLISYFLPMRAGARKAWASETEHFFCCHGSLVQANSTHNRGLFYRTEQGITICQYSSAELKCEINGIPVVLKQGMDTRSGNNKISRVTSEVPHRLDRVIVEISVSCDNAIGFDLAFRLPWWLKDEAVVTVNGAKVSIVSAPSSFIHIDRVWQNDTVRVELPKGITAVSLPDDHDLVAFLDGPVVLAGLCEEERILYGDTMHPEKILVPDNEREWTQWKGGYKTYDQDRGIRFKPLYEIGYEPFSVYFRIKEPK